MNRASGQRKIACTHCRYDDEEEFDAVKDVLAPKRVFLVLPPESPQQLEHLRSKLSSQSFDAGFTSQQACTPPYALSKRAVCIKIGSLHSGH